MSEPAPTPEERPEPPPADEEASHDHIVGENPDDDVLPISPSARRLAMVVGLLFIAVILGFLIAFIATHSERTEGGTMGSISPAIREASVA